MSQLIDTVAQDFAEARAAIKRQAVGAAARGELTDRPGAAPAVVLRRCRGALPGEALEEVDRYAHSARLLALAPPASHQAFRRWYVASPGRPAARRRPGLAAADPEPFPRCWPSRSPVVAAPGELRPAAAAATGHDRAHGGADRRGMSPSPWSTRHRVSPGCEPHGCSRSRNERTLRSWRSTGTGPRRHRPVRGVPARRRAARVSRRPDRRAALLPQPGPGLRALPAARGLLPDGTQLACCPRCGSVSTRWDC